MIEKFKTKNISPGKNTCEFVVLHHSAGNEKSDLAVLTGKTGRQASCHYYVNWKGEVYKLANDDQITWHAGESERKGKKNLNLYSIGIEVESGPTGNVYTTEQKKSVALLLQSLGAKYPGIEFLRHADIAPKRKWDISPEFYAPLSWRNYILSLFSKKMTEEQISLQIKTLMNLNSITHQILDDAKFEKVKKLLADTNKELLSLGYSK